jgi:hypothetical protein
MPFGVLSREDRDEMSPRAKVLLAFFALAGVWVAVQTGVIQALLALGLTSPLFAGLAVLGLFAYWALDELEDDDGATDVISKTSERAESASEGFLSGTATLIMGVATVALTIGAQLFDGIAAFIDVALTVPLASAQIGTGLAGVAGALGILAAPEVAVTGVVLLVAAFIARRNGADS